MPAREAIQLIHDRLVAALQPAIDALPAPASADAPTIAQFLNPYADDSPLTPASYPAVAVDHGLPEPMNQVRFREPDPGTGEWGDMRVPVAVRYLGSGGDTAAEHAAAGAALRAAYQVARRSAGETLGQVRLVGITEPWVEWPALYDGERVRPVLHFIALARDEAI
jgi:hypothetical protein